MTQSYINIGPGQTDLEGWVEQTFYGVRQNRQTGLASIDKIIPGDGVISLPDAYTVRYNDYVNWDWTYNTFNWYWGQNGLLIMEVL